MANNGWNSRYVQTAIRVYRQRQKCLKAKPMTEAERMAEYSKFVAVYGVKKLEPVYRGEPNG